MAQQTPAEAKELKACINDLIAIVALPAIWSGSAPAEIVRTLLDTLVGMLRLDFVYLRLRHSAGEPPIEVLRSPHLYSMTSLPPEIEELLKSWSGDGRREWPPLVRNVFGDHDLVIIPLPLGLEGESGILVAGSRRLDFPVPTERLLLSVAANQLAVWLQGAHLLREQKRVADELDQKVAQRTEELAAANAELRKQIAKEQSISLENKALYRELKDRERKIQRLIDSNIIGIVIWDLDGRVIDANDAFLHMVGYNREDLQAGLRWFDITPPEWQEAHARYEAEELKATGMMQVREKEYFRKDGSRVPVLIGAACFEGQPNQGVAYIVDLSAQKRAEEALRRSQAYLAEAQLATQTGSCAIDGATRQILYWSDEMFRLFGFDPQHGLPKWDQWVQRIHPEDVEKFRMAGDRTFGEKVHCDVEFRIVKPDGRVRHIQAIGHPVLSPNGELTQVIGTMVDVSERRRAEEERERLRQAQADLAHINRVSTMGELTAALAHEVKQPIAAAVTNAKTCLRWLSRDQPDLIEAREAASRLVKDVTRASDIISRVSSLFKKGLPQRESADVNEVIQEMMALLRSEAARYSISLVGDLSNDLPQVMVDRVQLQQVLLNLMLNGIEAMADLSTPGRLTVSSRRDDGQLLISVADVGTGIKPEQAERIFQAFFSSKPQGTGMGLAICRSIVESHGGRVWTTPNPGPGATFHFSLPIEPAADEAA
jgi:PAS domain S-box-containing protein